MQEACLQGSAPCEYSSPERRKGIRPTCCLSRNEKNRHDGQLPVPCNARHSCNRLGRNRKRGDALCNMRHIRSCGRLLQDLWHCRCKAWRTCLREGPCGSRQPAVPLSGMRSGRQWRRRCEDPASCCMIRRSQAGKKGSGHCRHLR